MTAEGLYTLLREFYPSGRMMNGTKREPPGHICVWNGNICTKALGKIWFGDLDLSDAHDQERLTALAGKLGETLYVLKEMDARFQTEAAPRFDRAIATVTASGVQFRDEEDGE